MKRLLIISPHLDDAVLSCGARIAQTVESGGEVLVVTCFTSPGEEATTDLRQLYEQRRADDSAALGLLGARFRHLGFVDAPFRNAAYYNFNTILFHHRLPSEEKTLVRSLGDILRQLAEEWQPDELLFPLGVGGHIDHHLVWESSMIFWERRVGTPDEICPISYYEDLPYALIPGWSAVRWNELGGEMPLGNERLLGDEMTLRNEMMSGDEQLVAAKMDLLETPYPFVQNYMSSEDDRTRSAGHYDREYARLGNGCWNARQWVISGNVFARNLHRMEARYLRSKSHAIAGYRSEWRVLFGPDEQTIPDMLAGEMNADFYTEINWALKTTE